MSSKNEDEARLYFITRSWLMGQVGVIILFLFVLALGKIDFIQTVIISAIAFFLSLAISRLFDTLIHRIVKRIIKFLNNHMTIKGFILKYF